MKYRAVFLALSATIVASTPAFAAEKRFEPASQWQVDNLPQVCRLSRDYRSGDERLTIRIEQFQAGAGMHLMLIGKPVERAENRHSFDVRLGSGTRAFDTRVADITLPDGRVGTLIHGAQLVPPGPTTRFIWSSPAQFAAIDEMAFTAPVMGTLVLQTKTLGRAMEEMARCHRQMVAGWGFDPSVQATLSRHAEPVGNAAQWLRAKDYPVRQRNRRRSSIVAFRLNVDAAGKPTACVVPRAYTPEEFVATTCTLLMQRASFTPALDAAGKPVASYYVNSVSWLTF